MVEEGGPDERPPLHYSLPIKNSDNLGVYQGKDQM